MPSFIRSCQRKEYCHVCCTVPAGWAGQHTLCVGRLCAALGPICQVVNLGATTRPNRAIWVVMRSVLGMGSAHDAFGVLQTCCSVPRCRLAVTLAVVGPCWGCEYLFRGLDAVWACLVSIVNLSSSVTQGLVGFVGTYPVCMCAGSTFVLVWLKLGICRLVWGRFDGGAGFGLSTRVKH